VSAALAFASRFPVHAATAIDCEDVRIREDAFSIEVKPGYFAVSVYILDLTAERVRSSSYGYLSDCPGFNRNWERPAIQALLTIDHSGVAWLEGLEKVELILDQTYDKPVSSGDRLPKALQDLGQLTSVMTARPYHDVAYMPQLGLTRLITATNAAITEYVARCERNLLYLNCTSNINGTHQSFSPISVGHAKLNLSAYARFTSPALRHDDGVNFKALKALMNDEPEPFTAAMLKAVAIQCSENHGRKSFKEKQNTVSSQADRQPARTMA
jgi:hypothetical protein